MVAGLLIRVTHQLFDQRVISLVELLAIELRCKQSGIFFSKSRISIDSHCLLFFAKALFQSLGMLKDCP
jgi:hypothetical protein